MGKIGAEMVFSFLMLLSVHSKFLVIAVVIIIVAVVIIIIIIIIIIIVIITELTLSKTLLENTVEFELQPVALDLKNLSQYF